VRAWPGPVGRSSTGRSACSGRPFTIEGYNLLFKQTIQTDDFPVVQQSRGVFMTSGKARVFGRRRWIFGAALLVTSGMALAVQGAPVLGNLVTQGRVAVTSLDATFDVSGSQYAFFSGDRVTTQAESAAMLRAESDGAVYVGPESSASVSGGDGAYEVVVHQGGVRFTFEPSVKFTISASGKTVAPAQLVKAADVSGGRVGGVVLIQDGEVVIHATDGELAVREADSEGFQTVRTGETFATEGADGALVRVVNPIDAPQDKERWRKVLWWFIGGGVAYWTYDQVINDDDKAEGPVGSLAR